MLYDDGRFLGSEARVKTLLLLAVVFMNSAAEATTNPSRVLKVTSTGDVSGCVVRIVDTSEPQSEQEHPCGDVMLPATGSHRLWIESGSTMSRQILNPGSDPVRLALMPATRVRVDVAPELTDVASVRLLHVSPESRRPFVREVLPGVEVLMPQGEILALALTGDGAVRAYSSARGVAGRVLQLNLARSRSTSAVVALLDGDQNGMYERVILRGEGHSQIPDLVAEEWSGVVAVWHAVSDRNAVIEAVEPKATWLPPVHVSAHPHALTIVRGAFQPLPAIHVRFLPTGEQARRVASSAALRLLREDGQAPAVERKVGPELEDERFQVIPSKYRLALEMSGWTTNQSVDLSAGTDETVDFEIAPLEVSGKITTKGEPTSARIALRNGANVVAGESDETGRYSLTVWRAGRYQLEVSVSDGEPYTDLLNVKEDTTYDVDLPPLSRRVRILDAKTGERVPGAKITMLASWSDPLRGTRRAGRTLTAGEDGVVKLPPLFPGSIELRGNADGYLESARTVQIVETTSPTTETIELHLEPVGEVAPVQLTLFDGRPAASAQVALVGHAGTIVWHGASGEDGKAMIPLGLEASAIAVQHPLAGSLVRRWNESLSSSMSLPVAGPPLELRVESAQGEPVAGADVRWLADGLIVEGALLAFLTHVAPLTDGGGTWTARNLPAEPLRFLVTRRASSRAIRTGSFDALAATVRFPWRSPVRIVVAD